VGLTTVPCKKKIVEKPPRNSAGFCGGGQGLSWAVEPMEEEEEEDIPYYFVFKFVLLIYVLPSGQETKFHSYRKQQAKL
jgi:hypothetical protein